MAFGITFPSLSVKYPLILYTFSVIGVVSIVSLSSALNSNSTVIGILFSSNVTFFSFISSVPFLVSLALNFFSASNVFVTSISFVLSTFTVTFTLASYIVHPFVTSYSSVDVSSLLFNIFVSNVIVFLS